MMHKLFTGVVVTHHPEKLKKIPGYVKGRGKK
jgi:hypothetical protein